MNTIQKQRGFTMAEVLVSMLILAVGLLGMAGLQVNGLRNNQSGYFRSQATTIAYDLADRMRANRAGNYLGVPNPPVLQAACLTTAGCTTAQMAQHDMAEWNAAIGAVLPSGTGTLVASGSGFDITIQWDDNKDNAVDGNDPLFLVNFQL